MGKDKKIVDELKHLSDIEKEEEEKSKTKKTEKKKQQSPKFTFKNPLKKQTKKVPLTFNIGLAVILFLSYLSVAFVSLPTFPQLLIIILPTLYILIKYIKLERELYDQKSS
jgi:uncharacterized membrane protein